MTDSDRIVWLEAKLRELVAVYEKEKLQGLPSYHRFRDRVMGDRVSQYAQVHEDGISVAW